jgi:hypothetical protein
MEHPTSILFGKKNTFALKIVFMEFSSEHVQLGCKGFRDRFSVEEKKN